MKPIPEMRCISPQTAEREGYQAITSPICPRREPEIFSSVQSSLRTADAVWIEAPGERYSAARKASELRTITEIEGLVTNYQRRDSNKEGRKP